MTDNTTLILIIAVISVVIAGVAGYYVMRFMRGSIKIFMTRTAFNLGEEITGRFELTAKKPIQGNRLTASLIASEVTRTREAGKTDTRRREIYKNETVIEGGRTYHPGFSESYEFVLPVPDLNEPNFLKSEFGGALKTAMDLLSDRRTTIEWEINVRLDALGVDLAASKSVLILS